MNFIIWNLFSLHWHPPYPIQFSSLRFNSKWLLSSSRHLLLLEELMEANIFHPCWPSSLGQKPGPPWPHYPENCMALEHRLWEEDWGFLGVLDQTTVRRYFLQFYGPWADQYWYQFWYAFLEVFEYYPEPRNEWVAVGDLQTAARRQAVLSIGPLQLPCLSTSDSTSIHMTCDTSRCPLQGPPTAPKNDVQSAGYSICVLFY